MRYRVVLFVVLVGTMVLLGMCVIERSPDCPEGEVAVLGSEHWYCVHGTRLQ